MDTYEWPEGSPLFDVNFDSVSEGVRGVGVLNDGDLTVSHSSNLDIEVATGDVWYNGSKYTLGAATTLTLSSASGQGRRWDSVVYDTTNDTPAIREGTSTEPPTLSDGEVLLAVVELTETDSGTDVSSVLNWRSDATDAANVFIDTTNADSSDVTGVIDEIFADIDAVDTKAGNITGVQDAGTTTAEDADYINFEGPAVDSVTNSSGTVTVTLVGGLDVSEHGVVKKEDVEEINFQGDAVVTDDSADGRVTVEVTTDEQQVGDLSLISSENFAPGF